MKTILRYSVILVALMSAASARADMMRRHATYTFNGANKVLPFQLEVKMNPFYVGFDCETAGASFVVKVWELGPNGALSSEPVQTKTVKMPYPAKYGIDRWLRVRELAVGRCYAVTIATTSGASRTLHWYLQDYHDNARKGDVTAHDCAAPLHEPCNYGTSGSRSLSTVVIEEVE